MALTLMSTLSEGSGQFPREGAAQTLGGYQLQAELGGGPHYVLHRARCATDARGDVVIKRLRAAAPGPGARARLLRAARVGMGLSVPNLVRVREVHDAAELFVVMEHVEGATLDRLIAQASDATVLRHLVPAFVDTLAGLSALHHWKSEDGAPSFLVHQAPTLHHMLVGADGVTRLLDLTHVHGPLLSAGTAYASSSEGTHAPEQFDASERLDPRCDIFLVGAALDEALTLIAERSDVASSSSRVAAHWTALRDVAQRALSPRPSARYWSADEMAFALRSLAEEADSYATPEEMATWVQRASPVHAAARSAFGVGPSCVEATPPLTSLALEDASYGAVLAPAPGVRDHTLTWPDEKTTIWLRDDDGDLQLRPHTTVVYERQRVYVAEPPLIVRDLAREPARHSTLQIALAAAVAGGLLVLGLRSAAPPQAATARAQEVQAPASAVQSQPQVTEAPAPAKLPVRSARAKATRPETASNTATLASAASTPAPTEPPTDAPTAPSPGPAELPENPY